MSKPTPNLRILRSLIDGGGVRATVRGELQEFRDPAKANPPPPKDRGFLDFNYTAGVGREDSTYLIKVLQKGRDLIKDSADDDGDPAEALQAIVDAIKAGEYVGTKPVVVVFDDGSIVRLNATKDRALATLASAAAKALVAR